MFQVVFVLLCDLEILVLKVILLASRILMEFTELLLRICQADSIHHWYMLVSLFKDV